MEVHHQEARSWIIRCSVDGCRWHVHFPIAAGAESAARTLRRLGWVVDDQGEYICAAHLQGPVDA